MDWSWKSPPARGRGLKLLAVVDKPATNESSSLFELTEDKFKILRSQIVTSSWGNWLYVPMGFTEFGAAKLSSVLKTENRIYEKKECYRNTGWHRHQNDSSKAYWITDYQFPRLEQQAEMFRIMAELGLKHEDHFREAYLLPALEVGMIEQTIWDWRQVLMW